MRFTVQITEILQKLVEVDAESSEEAEKIVRRQYRCENIVLDAAEYVETKIEVISSRGDAFPQH